MSVPPSKISSPEWKRKALHAGMGAFALALRYISWPVAALLAVVALLFNVAIMPRFGRTIYRNAGKKHDPGIVAYPATVLLVILLFRHELAVAAAIWGMMALGDPAAAVAGKLLGGPSLPWNRAKTWSGSIAYAAAGAVGGALAMAFVGRTAIGYTFSVFSGFALLGAFLESLDTGLDDNVAPGLGVAFAYAAVHIGVLASPGSPAAVSGGAPISAATAALVNLGIALVAVLLRIVSPSGGIAGAIAGIVILHFGGWGGYAVLWAFFLFGTIASKLGYAKKEELGTAQANRARRGARHVVANVAVGAWLAFAIGSRVTAFAVPVLALALAGAFAAALADTFGTELGTLYGRKPFLLSRLRRVSPGTRGAISLAGVLGGGLGALLVALAGAATGLYPVRLIGIVIAAGLAGSLAESALLDFSARRGIAVDHEFCNAFNTFVGAAVAWEIAASLALGRLYVPFGNLA
jgi:uncharacterized protein (TIGR00297 family)